jgi:hypothetical protein
VGLAEKFFLDQSDELFFDSSDILVAHVFQPGSNVALKNDRFRHFIPIDFELPQIHLVLGNFGLKLLDGLDSFLFLFHVDFLMVQVRKVELDRMTVLLLLIVELLVSLEKLIFLEIFWF